MKTLHRIILPFLFMGYLSACGSVAFTPASDVTDDTTVQINESVSASDSQVFVFATDFSSSGQLYLAQYLNGKTSLANSGVTLLGTEAIIKQSNSLLYVLHAGGNLNSVSTDNLQIIDPFDATTPYKTIGQFSTGNGTNPLDVVIDGNKAYISLYNPKADANNVDENGNPGDVIVMSTTTGHVSKRYSFKDYLDDDGDLQSNAYKMIKVGNILYVLIQDLESNTFASVSNGLIGMIDLTSQQILGVIELQCRNPSDLLSNDDRSEIIVACVDDFSYNSGFGGVERVDLDSEQSLEFISDENLGGYIERLASANGLVFGVVGRSNQTNFVFESKLIQMPQDFTTSSDVSSFIGYSDDVRSFFIQNNVVWVAYRVISTSQGDSQPNIKAFSLDTGLQLGNTVYPVVSGISIAGEL